MNCISLYRVSLTERLCVWDGEIMILTLTPINYIFFSFLLAVSHAHTPLPLINIFRVKSICAVFQYDISLWLSPSALI